MKHIRINKQKKALQALKAKTLDRSELDKNVFDMVLKTLYLNPPPTPKLRPWIWEMIPNTHSRYQQQPSISDKK